MTTLVKEILQFREQLERHWPRLIDAAPCRNEYVLEDAFVLMWRSRKSFTPTAERTFAHYFADQVKQAYRMHGEGHCLSPTPEEFELLQALRGAS